MKNFQVSFSYNCAQSGFIMFESKSIKEALEFFNNATFEGFFLEKLNAIEYTDDCSTIELIKIVDGEVTEFKKNEEGLEINEGWMVKKYSIS